MSTEDKIAKNALAIIDAQTALSKLSAWDLVHRVLETDHADNLAVVELMNRVYPGWEQHDTAPTPAPPPPALTQAVEAAAREIYGVIPASKMGVEFVARAEQSILRHVAPEWQRVQAELAEANAQIARLVIDAERQKGYQMDAMVRLGEAESANLKLRTQLASLQSAAEAVKVDGEIPWQPIAGFDWSKMQFVLIGDDVENVIRLRLWSPGAKRWEEAPQDTIAASHFMELPNLPTAARTSSVAGKAKEGQS